MHKKIKTFTIFYMRSEIDIFKNTYKIPLHLCSFINHFNYYGSMLIY